MFENGLKIDRMLRVIKLKVLRTNDTPHRIALGVAIGVFAGWSPALGLHTIMAVIMAFLLRANKIAAAAFVWISNPLTFFPIYYPSYIVGDHIMDIFGYTANETLHVHDILKGIRSNEGASGIFHAEFWRNTFEYIWANGATLWVGCTIIGFAAAIVSYVITYRFIVWHRRKKHIMPSAENQQ